MWGPGPGTPRMNYFRRNFDTLYIVLQVWLDGLVTLLACLVGFTVFKHAIPFDPPPDLNNYRQLFVLITGVVLASFWGMGLYQGQKSILNVEEYRGIFKATIIAFLVTATGIFLLRGVESQQEVNHWLYRALTVPYQLLRLDNAESYSRVLYMLVFGFTFLFTILERAISFRVLTSFYSRGIGNVNVAIVGTGPMARRLQQKLRLFPTLGYQFLGFIEVAKDIEQAKLQGLKVLGSDEDLDKLRDQHDLQRVLIAKPSYEEDQLVGLCKKLDNFGIQYQVVPRLYHFFSRRFTVETIDSLPLITPVPLRGKPVFDLVKRTIDICVSASILLLASPIMIALAVMIKRESAGPVFFTQIRQGANNRSFRMVKFRTMYADMCGDALTPSTSTDPRITRMGRMLRKTSLDELPQLLNVLLGDMSLVGPRPEMPFIVEQYNDTQMLRLDVKPGITGLWQVSEARNAPIHENVDYDLYYIENQSVFLDFTIMFLTVATMLRLTSTH